MKRFLFSFLGALLFWASMPQSFAKPIPEGIYERVARASLSGHPSQQQITARVTAVKTWMASQGGDTWYANYQSQFGEPTNSKELYVAETHGLSAHRLGYYYLHQPLTSGKDVVWYTCRPKQLIGSPTIRAECALAQWNAYVLTNDKKYRTAFLKWADLFMTQDVNGQFQWHIDVPARGMKTPWISGLTQSLYTSVLLRAYQTTHDQKYLALARKAFSWIDTPASKGGIYIKDSHGTWFEEYPNTQNPSHVLNGHIWALFGIWDYYRVTRDPKALAMFQAGTRVIKAEINRYDAGYWCVYAQTNDVDMIIGLYMQFVVQQMRALYGITGDRFFLNLSHKWGRDQETEAYFVHLAVAQFLKATPTLASKD